MKKLIIRVSIALIILIILGVVAVGIFLDSAVKRGIETVGPMLTKVEVKLDSVSLSLLSGAGKIKGLVVGNPTGFKTPSCIQVGSGSLSLQPGSVFSDKIIIKSINLQGPEITFETDLKGNNLSKLLSNVEAATGGGEQQDPKAAKKAQRKLQVDDFLITGAKVHVSLTALGTKSATVPLPEIHLSGLGQGPDGITVAELTKRVLQEVEKAAVQASSTAVADLTKDATGLTKGLGTTTSGAADTVTKGIGGLFKKN
jgi:uncharacterized protein involved in outer membrane biogenesis